MDIYFVGGDQPVNLRLFKRYGVKHISISFWEWHRRHTNDDLESQVPEGSHILIQAGISKKTGLDYEQLAQDYIEFCQANPDALIYDIDSVDCPKKVRLQVRDSLQQLPHAVAFPLSADELPHLARTVPRIGINARLGKSVPISDLRRLSADLYGSNINDVLKLRTGRFQATTTLAWQSPRRFGQIQIWSGSKLLHFTEQERPTAVRQHRVAIQKLGVSPELCRAGDPEALVELAVKSLLAMSEALSGRRRDRIFEVSTTTTKPASTELVSVEQGAVDITRVQLRPRAATTLPVAFVNGPEEISTIDASVGSQRMCDSCYLNSLCPAFEPESTCAFDLPIEIKTESQMQAAVSTLMTWQMKRIGFGVFGEEIEGQGIQPRVSAEFDRFMRMVKTTKEIRKPDSSADDDIMKQLFGNGGNDGQAAAQEGLPSEESEDEELIDDTAFGANFPDPEAGASK